MRKKYHFKKTKQKCQNQIPKKRPNFKRPDVNTRNKRPVKKTRNGRPEKTRPKSGPRPRVITIESKKSKWSKNKGCD